MKVLLIDDDMIGVAVRKVSPKKGFVVVWAREVVTRHRSEIVLGTREDRQGPKVTMTLPLHQANRLEHDNSQEDND